MTIAGTSCWRGASNLIALRNIDCQLFGYLDLARKLQSIGFETTPGRHSHKE
ncbi:hypothetical protein APR12_006858 [Nocardia amikacinitolerans]|nr:hypothetical protein [Nocardia amikacinitolerans]